MVKRKRFIKTIIFALFFLFLIFLSLNINSRNKPFTYQSEIWADKAGFYVYLPALFEYSFDARKFTDSIDINTGSGFFLDYKTNTVKTKYTYGVALMQLPFYTIACLLSNNSTEPKGFGFYHHKAVNIAAVFYLFVGILFLLIFLKNRFPNHKILPSVFLLLFGTNLYYYGIEETGMSHVYSFCLFSIFLYLNSKTLFEKESINTCKVFLLGIVGSLIILIRPTNILFVIVIPFIFNNSNILQKLRFFSNLKVFIPFFTGALLVAIPQLLYWKYAFGSILFYTYNGEYFNWMNPRLLHTWFSTDNGLFLYTPFFVVILGAMLYSFFRKDFSSKIYLIIFIVLSYVFSCWWAVNFGCSFGARNFVEYYALFSIPLVMFLNDARIKRLLPFIYIISFFTIIFNISMSYTFDECFYGGAWDWESYISLVTQALKKISFF